MAVCLSAAHSCEHQVCPYLDISKLLRTLEGAVSVLSTAKLTHAIAPSDTSAPPSPQQQQYQSPAPMTVPGQASSISSSSSEGSGTVLEVSDLNQRAAAQMNGLRAAAVAADEAEVGIFEDSMSL